MGILAVALPVAVVPWFCWVGLVSVLRTPSTPADDRPHALAVQEPPGEMICIMRANKTDLFTGGPHLPIHTLASEHILMAFRAKEPPQGQLRPTACLARRSSFESGESMMPPAIIRSSIRAVPVRIRNQALCIAKPRWLFGDVWRLRR